MPSPSPWRSVADATPALTGTRYRRPRGIRGWWRSGHPDPACPDAKGCSVLRIGLLGGMSWESSAEYYRLANEAVRDRLGGPHSARILLSSLDFAEIEDLQVTGEWDRAAEILAAEAAALEAAGAELLLLCTNTMHKVADQVQAAVTIPLLHLADTTAAAVRAAGLG